MSTPVTTRLPDVRRLRMTSAVVLLVALVLSLSADTSAAHSNAAAPRAHRAAAKACKTKRRKHQKSKPRACPRPKAKKVSSKSSPPAGSHPVTTGASSEADTGSLAGGGTSSLIETLTPPQSGGASEAHREDPTETHPVETPVKEETKHEESKHEEAKEETTHEEAKPQETKHEEKMAEAPAAPARLFASTSFWNATLSSSAPLDSSSAAVVAELTKLEGEEQSAKKGPTINTKSWSVPVYTVPANQPTVPVTLLGAISSALQSAWSAVPLPSNAQPAVGTDEHLVVWQPSTNRLWEFWHLEKIAGLWVAGWGGAIDDVSKNQGVYSPEAWAGATNSWGASASSLSIAGGLITLEDLELGQINHALAISVPNVRAGAYASPAHRTDGESKEAASLPEGAHLRLDPSLNLASLHLPKLVLLMAEAAQRYGIVVRDKASDIAFYGQDPVPTGTEPYTGTKGYFEGRTAASLLASFPWSHLQLLKMELHNTT